MVTRISEMLPAPALPAPGTDLREQTLRLWHTALESEPEKELRAFLLHQLALVHEGRDDLAAAAREELAATKEAGSFVEPVESLIGISARSRSQANLKKLLLRLAQLCRSDAERVRVALHLAALHAHAGELPAARTQLEIALRTAQDEGAVWLLFERVAALEGDLELRARAAMGRAGSSASTEVRGILVERAARTLAQEGRVEEALETLRRGVDELCSFRLLRAWELIALGQEDWREACDATSRTLELIEALSQDPQPLGLKDESLLDASHEGTATLQFRVSVYALLAGEGVRAREASKRLLEFAPDSPWAAQNHLALCLFDRDYATASALLRSWYERVEPAERPAVAAATWWVAEQAQDPAAAAEAAALLTKEAGDWSSLLLRLQGLRTNSEPSAESARAVWESALSLAPLSDIGAAHIARAVFDWLWSSDADQAARSLAELRLWASTMDDSGGAKSLQLSAHDSSIASSLQLVAARLCGDTASERAALLALYDAASYDDRAALAWDGLRLACSGRSGELRGDTSGHESSENSTPWWLPFKESWTLDPWSSLLLGALSLERMAPEKVLAMAEEANVEAGGLEPEGLRALTLLVHHWARQGGFRWDQWWPQLDERTEDHAWEPLTLGMRLNQVTQEDRPLALANAAEKLDDPTLTQAFFLCAAFEAVRSGALADAKDRFEQECARATSESMPTPYDTLARWTAYALAEGNAARLLSQLEQRPDPERHLDHFLLRFAEDRAFQSRVVNGEVASTRVASRSQETSVLQAERLVRSLAAGSIPALEQATTADQVPSSVSLLPPATICALRFSLAATPEERLAEAAEWRGWSESQSDGARTEAALFGSWVAAIELDAVDQADGVAWELAQRLRSADWATLIDPSHLPRQEREAFWQQTEEMLSQALDQDARELLAWTRFARADSDPTGEPAWDFLALARGLSGDGLLEIDEPDVQLSMLLAAYEAAHRGDDALALKLFEALSQSLPSDLAVVTGLRIVAERACRHDLHAHCLTELARHAEDNRQAADLWERAGALFQDHLGQDDKAEECFEAALGRRPGSALAFERVYRLARKRGDRSRLVELIDARLDAVHSETLRIELLWEKARYCRLLGRRNLAVLALQELLRLAPDHLPALALSAELELLDERWDYAALQLRHVALHPETPAEERRQAGLKASDLFEMLEKPRAAVDLLDQLALFGIATHAAQERRARCLARLGEWGAALTAFQQLNDEQDVIEQRLQSARMMLVIVRDELKDPGALKEAARRVLRDDPLDEDAVDVALRSEYGEAERARLLTPAREDCRQQLRNNPLDPEKIERFAALCSRCGDDGLERASLGLLALLGQLSEKQMERLDLLQARCPSRPSALLSGVDLEKLAGPSLLGVWGRVLARLEPHASRELMPSLAARGVSPLMRIAQSSGDFRREEASRWADALGVHDLDFYSGGQDADAVVVQTVDCPTLIVGAHIEFPLRRSDRARLAAQLGAARWGGTLFINLSERSASRWLEATRQLSLVAADSQSPDLAELVRHLGQVLPRTVRDELFEAQRDLERSGVSEAQVLADCRKTALRTAVLAAGDVSVVRELPEYLPDREELRVEVLSDLIRFALGETYFSLRKKLGLEGA